MNNISGKYTLTNDVCSTPFCDYFSSFLLNCLKIPGLCKCPEASVISPFNIIRKTTSRQLFHSKMILYAVTANTFFITSAIRTITVFQISLFFTFHINSSTKNNTKTQYNSKYNTLQTSKPVKHPQFYFRSRAK